MGVLVKNMDMPKSCYECPMLDGSDECCLLDDDINFEYNDADIKTSTNLCPLIEPMDNGTLTDWYINSIDNTVEPIWTDEHIEELLNDFYVIPKEEA